MCITCMILYTPRHLLRIHIMVHEYVHEVMRMCMCMCMFMGMQMDVFVYVVINAFMFVCDDVEPRTSHAHVCLWLRGTCERCLCTHNSVHCVCQVWKRIP